MMQEKKKQEKVAGATALKEKAFYRYHDDIPWILRG
jgi:hypothetical protein